MIRFQQNFDKYTITDNNVCYHTITKPLCCIANAYTKFSRIINEKEKLQMFMTSLHISKYLSGK